MVTVLRAVVLFGLISFSFNSIAPYILQKQGDVSVACSFENTTDQHVKKDLEDQDVDSKKILYHNDMCFTAMSRMQAMSTSISTIFSLYRYTLFKPPKFS